MDALESTSERSMQKQVSPWIICLLVFLFVFVLWGWLGFKPPIRDAGQQSRDSVHQLRGASGDQFGAVNALFSGLAFAGVVLALVLQRRDLIQTNRQHAETLRTQVLLQLMDEIRSKEWGNAHAVLTRSKGLSRDERIAEFMKEHKQRPLTGELNQCRRTFVRPIYKVWHLHTAKVIDDKLAAQIITENIAKTVDEIIEPYSEVIADEINPGEGLAEPEREFFDFVNGLRDKGAQAAEDSGSTPWEELFSHHIPSF